MYATLRRSARLSSVTGISLEYMSERPPRRYRDDPSCMMVYATAQALRSRFLAFIHSWIVLANFFGTRFGGLAQGRDPVSRAPKNAPTTST